MQRQVTIHTDGACSGNPGPGGYGVVLQIGERRKELSGGFRLTTNNRMELLAAIEGLAALRRPCAVSLYTDSKYIADAVNKGWARRWRANGWRRNKTEKAVNPDLWARLLDLLAVHDVEIVWVRGHAGDPGNERADALAVAASKSPDLAADSEYESQARQPTPTPAPRTRRRSASSSSSSSAASRKARRGGYGR